jgi:hypothetical protein
MEQTYVVMYGLAFCEPRKDGADSVSGDPATLCPREVQMC